MIAGKLNSFDLVENFSGVESTLNILGVAEITGIKSSAC